MYKYLYGLVSNQTVILLFFICHILSALADLSFPFYLLLLHPSLCWLMYFYICFSLVWWKWILLLINRYNYQLVL